MPKYLVIPEADGSDLTRARLYEDEALTGLANGTAYRAFRLSAPSPGFTPAGPSVPPDPGPAPIPLPVVSVTPTAAIGVARLVAGYTGPAMRVINGTVETDIGFASRHVDLAAIAAARAGAEIYCTQFYDQSGNGHDFSQSDIARRPGVYAEQVINGAQAVSIDGNRLGTLTQVKALVNATLPSDEAGFTEFLVTRPLFSAASNFFTQAPATANPTGIYSWGLVQGSSVAGDFGLRINMAGTAVNPANRALLPPMQPNIITFATGPAGITRRMDGTQERSGARPAALARAGKALGILGDATSAYNGQFDLLAYVFYPGVLSDAEIALVEAALKANFNTDPAHDAILVLDGDSRVEGYGATRNLSWARMLLPNLTTPAKVFNTGIAGHRLQWHVANVARIAGIREAGKINVVALIGMGINDLTNGRTAAQLQADFITYAAGLHADQRLLCTTIPPHNGHNATQNTQRQSFNTWLLANWQSHADACFDLAAVAGLDAQNATHWFDAVHFNAAGHALMEAELRGPINVLLAP